MRMLPTLPILFVTLLCLPAAGGEATPLRGVPLLVWDVTFNDQEVGRPPRAEDRFRAAERSDWERLPLTRYQRMDFVTRTRTARVEESAFGLDEKPLVFTMPDNRQPHWGPRVFFVIPHKVADTAARLELSIDVSKNNVTRLAGLHLLDVAGVNFDEAGKVLVNGTGVTGYVANRPISLRFLIDNQSKRVRVFAGEGGEPTDFAWRKPQARRFATLRLDGLLPGGYARGPGRIAFDNIRLRILEFRPTP